MPDKQYGVLGLAYLALREGTTRSTSSAAEFFGIIALPLLSSSGKRLI